MAEFGGTGGKKDDIQLIKYKLDGLAASQDTMSENIKEISEKLLDPDDGLYSRVKEIQVWAEKHEINDEKLRDDILDYSNEAEKKIAQLEKNAASLIETIEPIAQDFHVKSIRKAWTDRIFIAIIGAVVAFAVPYALKLKCNIESPQQNKITDDVKKAYDFGQRKL